MSFKQSNTRLTVILVITALMTVLQACAPSTTKAPVEETRPVVQPKAETGSIEEMIAGLDPAEAIRLLENTASGSSRNRAFTLLSRAAEISAEHEPVDVANQRITALRSQFPESDKAVKIAILQNRVLLKSQQPASIIETLDRLNTRATAEEKLLILDLKAEALMRAGFPIESVQIRISLDEALQATDTSRQELNDRRLWGNLMKVNPGLISGHITEIPDIFSGWLELADLVNRYPFDSAALNTELDKWITRNQGHPANRVIVDYIRQKQIATSNHPGHIALILPLSGKLSPVGSAIRDGFMSAFLETRRVFGTQIILDVYDSRGDAEAARMAVQNANDRGAEFIIGPLAKEAVGAAIDANQYHSMPAAQDASANITLKPAEDPSKSSADMLTLNRIDESTITTGEQQITSESSDHRAQRIYQFDLSPETEALQAAERASKEGLTRAMVMVPENVWGNRIYEAFTQRYQELGGSVVALDRFKKGSADFSSGINNELNLDISKIRHKQLESFLGSDLGFIPRRRQDIDVIFIAASPQEGRLIKPQLKFFYASDIPVYATSSIYTGTPNASRDKDLENIVFCDMPWLLIDKPAPGSLQRTIQTSWPQDTAKYMRFYALGADAFLLLPQLDWLKNNRNDWVSGGTGKLSLDENGIIQRQLSWASFKNAVPRLIEYTN